jgi:hypothetical protein
MSKPRTSPAVSHGFSSASTLLIAASRPHSSVSSPRSTVSSHCQHVQVVACWEWLREAPRRQRVCILSCVPTWSWRHGRFPPLDFPARFQRDIYQIILWQVFAHRSSCSKRSFSRGESENRMEYHSSSTSITHVQSSGGR